MLPLELYLYFIMTIFALGWGSFSTMAVYRLTHDEPWIGRKPFCTECNHDLSFIDYISIISYFLFRGRCRYCKHKYSYGKIYFFTELSLLIYFYLSFHENHFNQIFIIQSFLAILSVILSIIFFTHKKQNKELLYLLFFVACLYRVLVDQNIYD